MALRKIKSDTRLSLADIFREVKTTVQVFLTDRGVDQMKHTPYVREGSFLNCSRLFDAANPNYLFVEVRYYLKDSTIPRHASIAVPHECVRYMAADKPFHVKVAKS